MTLEIGAAALYDEAIKAAAKAQAGAGRLTEPTIELTVDNPLCGDRITLGVRLEHGHITNGQGRRIIIIGNRTDRFTIANHGLERRRERHGERFIGLEAGIVDQRNGDIHRRLSRRNHEGAVHRGIIYLIRM